MNLDPNPLYFEMMEIYSENRHRDEKVTICNEGSSRSSKTWDTFFFILTYCDHNRDKRNEIYVLRDTLVNCRDYTWKEFRKCLVIAGVWDQSKAKEYPKPYYDLFGNDIYFRGLDDEDNMEGYPSDIVFVNEALETEKNQVEGIDMRCRKLIIMDWNPKFTQHWCFDLEGQPNVHFTHSTYKQNKHLEKSIVRKIESYEPYMPGSYEVIGQELFYRDQPISDTNQPPPHPQNVQTDTADLFRWRVYGLGLRSANEGLIFKNVRYIDAFPDLDHIYGMDFGFTVDPLTLVKYAEDPGNIYLQLLCYQPIEDPGHISEYMDQIGVERHKPISADSSDKHVSENKGAIEMVHSLQSLGWFISKVEKSKSVMFWLTSMKNKRINIVKNHLYLHAKKEQENYTMKKVNGITINQPIDKFNHFWDGSRYAHMAWNAEVVPPVLW